MSKRPPGKLYDQPNPKRAPVGLNGAPGQVGSFGTHPRGPNGPPPIGSTISVQSRGNQIHQQTNNTGSIPILTTPKSNGDKLCLPGEIMFVKNTYCSRGAHASHNIMCFRELNALLENGDDKMDTWSYLGVVRQQVLSDNRSGKHSRENDTQLYNVDVYGRTNVRNIFKHNKIKNGDHLQLAVVQYGERQRLLAAINDKILLKDHYRGWTVEEVIPIGIISNALSAQSRTSANMSSPVHCTNIDQTKNLKMLEMLIV